MHIYEYECENCMYTFSESVGITMRHAWDKYHPEEDLDNKEPVARAVTKSEVICRDCKEVVTFPSSIDTERTGEITNRTCPVCGGNKLDYWDKRCPKCRRVMHQTGMLIID